MPITTMKELEEFVAEFGEEDLFEALEDITEENDVESGRFFMLGLIDSRVEHGVINHETAARLYAHLGVSREEACAYRQDYAINKD